MPRIKHIKQKKYEPSFRSSRVVSMYDVPVKDDIRREWDINLPIENKKWNIGLIVGASGSGKTSIAREAFKDNIHDSFHWSAKCLLDDFPKDVSVNDIVDCLTRVGFSSPPNWLLSYDDLSNGQKFRAEMARCLLEYKKLFVFDEFSSFVDRTAAQVGCFAYQKAIRKLERQFVAVTCHYDVEEWLQPDWVLDVSKNTFRWGCLQRPKIEINVHRCEWRNWGMFKNYHYLTSDIHKSARFYIALYRNIPVAISSCLSFPHPKVKNTWRGHRTVVLPDYQGLGIGVRLSDVVGDILLQEGKRLISVTSHPSMIHYRVKSEKWKLTKKPKRNNPTLSPINRKSTATDRLTCSFEYLGERQSDLSQEGR